MEAGCELQFMNSTARSKKVSNAHAFVFGAGFLGVDLRNTVGQSAVSISRKQNR